MRKLTSLFAATIFALHLTGCTSGDSKDDSMGDEAVAESTEGTDGDLANLDAPPAESTDSSVASNDGANEGFLDEQLPEDALGESTKTAQAEPPPADITSENTTPPPAIEEPPKSDTAMEAAPIETPPDSSVAAVDTGSPAATEPPPVTSTEPDTSSMASTSSTEPSAPVAEAKPKASLKKIESAPITREGILLNAVYIARPGDNYKKISQLIYGNSDKVKELKKVNPSVKPRVGDKIYYNSPLRPADDTKLVTYYEDAGLAPEVYVAQEGDDLKKLSKKWLGSKDSWKEVWATNMIDSKDVLPAGTEIRYWKSAPASVAAAPVTPETPKTDVAMNTPPAMEMTPPPAEMPAPPQEQMPDMPPPPPAQEMAQPPPPVAENAPPPPPPQEMAPPPPPPADVPPPPPADAVNPPPPPTVAKKAPPAGDLGGMDNDMMMSLAGAGIIAAGLAAVIIIRKRRQNREMASAFNDTQVGT